MSGNDILQLSDQFYRYDKFFHLWDCHSIYQSPLEDAWWFEVLNLIKFVRSFLGKVSKYFSNPNLINTAKVKLSKIKSLSKLQVQSKIFKTREDPG
jgi:hypothetical protein